MLNLSKNVRSNKKYLKRLKRLANRPIRYQLDRRDEFCRHLTLNLLFRHENSSLFVTADSSKNVYKRLAEHRYYSSYNHIWSEDNTYNLENNVSPEEKYKYKTRYKIQIRNNLCCAINPYEGISVYKLLHDRRFFNPDKSIFEYEKELKRQKLKFVDENFIFHDF